MLYPKRFKKIYASLPLNDDGKRRYWAAIDSNPDREAHLGKFLIIRQNINVEGCNLSCSENIIVFRELFK